LSAGICMATGASGERCMVKVDLSLFGAALLIALCAAKEMNHGHRKNGRIPQERSANRTDTSAFAAACC